MPSWQHLICLENKAQTCICICICISSCSWICSWFCAWLVVASFCVYGANLASFVGRDFCLISTQWATWRAGEESRNVCRVLPCPAYKYIYGIYTNSMDSTSKAISLPAAGRGLLVKILWALRDRPLIHHCGNVGHAFSLPLCENAKVFPRKTSWWWRWWESEAGFSARLFGVWYQDRFFRHGHKNAFYAKRIWVDPGEKRSLEPVPSLSPTFGLPGGFLSVYSRAFLFYGKVNKM